MALIRSCYRWKHHWTSEGNQEQPNCTLSFQEKESDLWNQRRSRHDRVTKWAEHDHALSKFELALYDVNYGTQNIVQPNFQ